MKFTPFEYAFTVVCEFQILWTQPGGQNRIKDKKGNNKVKQAQFIQAKNF